MERELRYVTFSDWDGTFRIENIPSNARYVTFSLPGYSTVAYTINPRRFASGEEIVLNPVLEYSNAVIRGQVLSALDGQPLSGVRVDCGLKAVTTDADGRFEITSLPLNDFTLTYTIADGSVYRREIAMGDFVDSVAEMPVVRLGGGEVLPGMKWQDLADAPLWYANNYHRLHRHQRLDRWLYVGLQLVRRIPL